MKPAPGIAEVIEEVTRTDRGRLLSALIRELRDFQLAEDALQDAAEAALVHWGRGVPSDPRAWLLRVARRKAIDRIRRAGRWRDRAAILPRWPRPIRPPPPNRRLTSPMSAFA